MLIIQFEDVPLPLAGRRTFELKELLREPALLTSSSGMAAGTESSLILVRPLGTLFSDGDPPESCPRQRGSEVPLPLQCGRRPHFAK